MGSGFLFATPDYVCVKHTSQTHKSNTQDQPLMDPPASEIKKSNKNTSKKSSNKKKFVLIANGQESTENIPYRVQLDSAPSHMKSAIKRSSTKRFDSLIRDGPQGMDGLVDDADEEADERADEIMDWLEDQCTRENEYKYPFGHVDIFISLAGCM